MKRCFKNFAKFTGKHLCQGLFFIKVSPLRPAALLKNRLWYRCFPVNFAKFLGTLFIEHFRWLLLILAFLYRTSKYFHSTVNIITEYCDKRREISSQFKKKKWRASEFFKKAQSFVKSCLYFVDMFLFSLHIQ